MSHPCSAAWLSPVEQTMRGGQRGWGLILALLHSSLLQTSLSDAHEMRGGQRGPEHSVDPHSHSKLHKQ